MDVVQCPKCGAQYGVPPQLVGKQVPCQACGTLIPIPAPGAAPAPAPVVQTPGSITCGGCGKQYQSDPRLAGKQIQCPGCGGMIQVPALGAAGQPAQTAAVHSVAPDAAFGSTSFFADELDATKARQEAGPVRNPDDDPHSPGAPVKKKRKRKKTEWNPNGEPPLIIGLAAGVAAIVVIFSFYTFFTRH